MAKYEFTGNAFETHDPVRAQSPADQWQNAEVHRQRVTALLLETVRNRANARLCVWGAGNCNDIDLRLLAEAFAEVHLVDIDSGSLQHGAEYQKVNNDPAIHLHSDVDLTGVYDLLEQYAHAREANLIDQIIAHVGKVRLESLGRFDVLASTCVLSQIVDKIVACLGESHSRFAETMLALRNGHIQSMLDHVWDGGEALLVTDVVSSETLPQILQPVENLSGLLQSAIAERNHFHGVNPFALKHLLDQDANFKDRLSSTDPYGPWIWNATNRHYVCLAFRMHLK